MQVKDNLMVGDLVKFQGQICIIEEISAKGWVHLLYADTKRRMNLTSDYILDDLQLVKLTKEILGRNFICKNNSYVISDDFCKLKIDERLNTAWQLAFYNETDPSFSVISNIFFVHELQHALKLCGLNIEIKI